MFVDAENHFLRGVRAAEEVIGSEFAPQALAKAIRRIPGIEGFPPDIEGMQFGWDPEIQLFWDCRVLSTGGLLSDNPVRVHRAIYACSCTGDDNKAHQMRVRLRNYGFEPIVVKELKSHRTQRENSLQNQLLIDKPKGCDIAIASRMVSDAAADLYDYCFLFTSDADFLPAIEAVRRLGKTVWVFGFVDALQENSPFLYVPDKFVDLTKHIELVWKNHGEEVGYALGVLEEKKGKSPK